MDDDTLKVERDDGVATLRIAQPVGDAARDLPTAVELVRQLDGLEADDELRVLLLMFSGAAPDPLARPAADTVGATAAAVERVGRFARPVVAAIDGDAFGVALELALACDLRLGTPDSAYGMPRIRWGVMPYAGATQRLPRLVGGARATDLVLTGEPLGSAEAQRIGLVQRIAGSGELAEQAGALAAALARFAPASMQLTKEALDRKST